MGILGILSYILGPIMKFIYNIVPNYGITIILFTLLVRLISIPLTIGGQKSMAKMSVIQPMMVEIQTKYKNNPQKQNEEMQKLQTEYGYNPTSGCLPQLLNFFVLFGVIDCVYYPLQRMLNISREALEAVAQALNMGNFDYRAETSIMSAIKASASAADFPQLTADQYAAIKNFNMDFFGINLCEMPQLGFNILIILPVIACVTMIIANVYAMNANGSSQMSGAMRFMPWIMSIWFAFFCFQVPLAFSLYYTVSNLAMLVQTLVLHQFYSPEKIKEQYAAELAAKKEEKRRKKQVHVTDENGNDVVMEVNSNELNRLRLEMARKMDAEKYADERTTPLTEEERAALNTKKKKK